MNTDSKLYSQVQHVLYYLYRHRLIDSKTKEMIRHECKFICGKDYVSVDKLFKKYNIDLIKYENLFISEEIWV